MDNQISSSLDKLNESKGEKLLDKYEDIREDIKSKKINKLDQLDEEFKIKTDEDYSVAYYQKKIGIEANSFKKMTHSLEKQEEEIHKELEKDLISKEKDTYLKERSE
jgi:hypothetical protein